MKKLLLLTTLFLAFNCSKDDDTDTGVDPIIGNWSVNSTISEEIEGQIVSIALTGSMVFNSDGSGNQNFTFSFDGESQTENESFTWSNQSSDPDFKSSMQVYIIDGDNLNANFSNNFRSVIVSDSEGLEITMTKN